MKKLVYILSVAIGLIMTGCAQWEEFDSLSPETWGPKAELTIEAPDTLKSDVLSFQLVTKNATHMGLLLSLAPVEVNYTALLQGNPEVTADVVGVDYSEVNPEGEDFSYNIPGVVAGEVYYIYVVVANEAGVQTTATHVVGAIDVEAPIITSTPQLTATENGRRVTLSFSENIIRDETMGAIEYATYLLNVETGEASLYTQGSDVTAVASGSKLTVTLPVVFDANSYYVVTLSFAEGAVTDLYGNKMAPVASSFDASTGDVTNGYWWLVEPAGNEEPTEFFADGDYVFNGVFTYDGKDYYEGDIPFSMSFVSDGYDMGNIFENAPFTGTRWELKGVAKAMFDGDEYPFPGFSYEYVSSEDGLTYKYITIIDPENGWIPCVGNAEMQDGSVFKVYLAAVTEEGEMYPYWDFVLADADHNVEAPVEDLLGHFSLEAAPCILIDQNEGTGQDPKWGIIVMFDSVTLSRGGAVEAASYKVYKEPLTLENVKMNLGKLSLEKDFLFNK